MQQRPAAHAEARDAELGRLLEERLAQSAMTEEEGARIRAALDSLEATLTQAGEEWCVRPFGSVPSTFHTRGADVDVTCLRRGGLPAGQTPASLMSEKIGPLFRDHPRFKILEQVLRARVPIIKLRFDDQLDVDLSCQNTRGLQNTRLLRGYAHLDDRVRSLVKTVKLWAKVAGVCGASRGRLSSYSFALLAIYYMQVDQEVRLPISKKRGLPVAAFREEAHAGQDDERLVAACRGRWSCAPAPAELLERFFRFYSDNGSFWEGQEVVSVRLGKRLAATEARFGSLHGRHAWRLHIEDPFLLERNLNCVLGRLQERRNCGWPLRRPPAGWALARSRSGSARRRRAVGRRPAGAPWRIRARSLSRRYRGRAVRKAPARVTGSPRTARPAARRRTRARGSAEAPTAAARSGSRRQWMPTGALLPPRHPPQGTAAPWTHRSRPRLPR
ncbi:unnamed protein product [Prorocentrum cordatum]|uniref:Poly(A) RNA polymerase mitochondrial-like central palm domain-containing protein n=1 Tax=Prorocentrum cordatum TaxID=2364126 RepID=A0ABN9TGZ1_9DINO|nr:unnamed protein product [Polarella glacialis]